MKAHLVLSLFLKIYSSFYATLYNFPSPQLSDEPISPLTPLENWLLAKQNQ